jgi:hypothetical protein
MTKIDALLRMWIADGDTEPEAGSASIQFQMKDSGIGMGGIVSIARRNDRELEGVFACETAIPLPDMNTGGIRALQTTIYFTADDLRWVSRQQDGVAPDNTAQPKPGGGGLFVGRS